jgi:uncharacterized protein YkwD
MKKARCISIALFIGLLTLFVAPTLLVTVTADPPHPTPQPVKEWSTGDPLTLIWALGYPTDPTADTDWPYSGENSVTDIQTRFNTARTNENAQLGTSVPMLTMPSQAEWNARSDDEKALWLINQERIDRGVAPLHGLETNVDTVAQTYAQYLLDNDAFGHTADGRDPWQRLNDNAAIGACHDFLSVAENLAVLWGGWTLPIERAVHNWIYDDKNSAWGHRHAILWYPYNDNSGPAGKEGFLGIGRATGTHQGYPNSDIIVMNVFDPCSTWTYADTAPTAPSGLTATPVPPTQINLSWTDNSDNESGFRIERSPDGTTWTEIATVGANVTTYSNTGLTCNQTYYYRVRAYNAQGNSGYSNTVSVAPAGDIYEPDNTSNNAKSITVNGAAQSHTSHVAGDEDWAKFMVTAGGTYTITTSNLGANADTDLYLYGTDGTTELRNNDDCPGGGLESCINGWEGPANGTYFIRVLQFGGAGGCAGYSYDLAVIGPAQQIFLPIILKNRP